MGELREKCQPSVFQEIVETTVEMVSKPDLAAEYGLPAPVAAISTSDVEAFVHKKCSELYVNFEHSLRTREKQSAVSKSRALAVDKRIAHTDPNSCFESAVDARLTARLASLGLVDEVNMDGDQSNWPPNHTADFLESISKNSQSPSAVAGQSKSTGAAGYGSSNKSRGKKGPRRGQ